MKYDRWTPGVGEIFKGDKPELIGPKVDLDMVLEIMLGQLKVLQMMTCPAIYIPTEQAEEIDRVIDKHWDGRPDTTTSEGKK